MFKYGLAIYEDKMGCNGYPCADILKEMKELVVQWLSMCWATTSNEENKYMLCYSEIWIKQL